MSRPVIAIGECLVDLIAPKGSDLLSGESLTIREGGAPANVAVGLARLGVPVQMRSVIGGDPFGTRLHSRLASEGVDVSHIRVLEGTPTTIAFAWSDDAGDGHFRIHHHADRELRPADVEFSEAEAVVIGSVALAGRPSADAILTAIRNTSDKGIPLVMDVNYRPGKLSLDEIRMRITAGLTASSVVKISVDDARYLWGATDLNSAADALEKFDPPVAVITDGGRGAMLRVGQNRIYENAFSVVAVEPTGAGDAFTAAFISRMIERNWQGADRDDLRFAMASGALATTKPGAMDGLPTREQVVEFLNANTA